MALTEKEAKIRDTSKSFSNAPKGCYVHVHMGNAPGKTTSALGVALRSLGHGRDVSVIQFLKGRGDELGEYRIQERLGGYSVKQFGRPVFIDAGSISEEDKSLAIQGLDLARKMISDDKPHVLILDEINVALYYGLLSIDEVIELLSFAKSSNDELDIFLTGRYPPQQILDLADFITEMNEIKRPDSFLSRKGVGF